MTIWALNAMDCIDFQSVFANAALHCPFLISLVRAFIFWYLVCMRIDINPRGNGACPLCASHGNCRIQRRLSDNVDTINSPGDDELEIVVYSCPYFKEKVAP